MAFHLTSRAVNYLGQNGGANVLEQGPLYHGCDCVLDLDERQQGFRVEAGLNPINPKPQDA